MYAHRVLREGSWCGGEVLAADAALFMACCFVAFWSFKTKPVRLRHLLRLIMMVHYMLALTIMILICAVIAYAIV